MAERTTKAPATHQVLECTDRLRRAEKARTSTSSFTVSTVLDERSQELLHLGQCCHSPQSRRFPSGLIARLFISSWLLERGELTKVSVGGLVSVASCLLVFQSGCQSTAMCLELMSWRFPDPAFRWDDGVARPARHAFRRYLPLRRPSRIMSSRGEQMLYSPFLARRLLWACRLLAKTVCRIV